MLIIAATIAANSSLVLAKVAKNSIHLPYHTLNLTGMQWVKELLCGNPQHIEDNLGLHKCCFCRLVTALEIKSGLHLLQKGVTTNEQVAIFLYIVNTSLTMRSVGERVQHSMDMIHKYVPHQSNQINAFPSHTKLWIAGISTLY
jgi:hypothetical protein